MSSDLYAKVKTFVDNSFEGKNVEHFDKTVYWTKKLKPEADEALLIAAYSHDIQRAFRPKKLFDKIGDSKRGFQDEEMMKFHQEDGAEIMEKFLRENGAEKGLIDRVSHLISRHEVGGDKDQNLLKDADSLSFFETNVKHFITDKAKKFSKAKVKNKFDWMYKRISSPTARKIVRPMYRNAIKQLEKS